MSKIKLKNLAILFIVIVIGLLAACSADNVATKLHFICLDVSPLTKAEPSDVFELEVESQYSSSSVNSRQAEALDTMIETCNTPIIQKETEAVEKFIPGNHTQEVGEPEKNELKTQQFSAQEDNPPNPYTELSECRTYWRYDLFEAFRGAESVEFNGSLYFHRDYSHIDTYEDDDFEDYRNVLNCTINLPQSTESEPSAEQINAYYQEIFSNYIEEGDELWNENSNDWYLNDLGYYYEEAYLFENVLTVVLSCDDYTNWRLTISWNPFTDVFSTVDGRKLCLDDLFFVSRDVYLPVLETSLLNASMCFSRDYDPTRDDEFKPTFQGGILEYLEDVSFAVTPAGLVFIYPVGVAECMVAGIVLLHVPYKDLQGILNPVYFPEHAQNLTE